MLAIIRYAVNHFLVRRATNAMTEQDMRVLLKSAKAQAGSWEALANQWDTSADYLRMVAGGTKNVTEKIANHLGFSRVKQAVFEPLREERA